MVRINGGGKGGDDLGGVEWKRRRGFEMKSNEPKHALKNNQPTHKSIQGYYKHEGEPVMAGYPPGGRCSNFKLRHYRVAGSLFEPARSGACSTF